MESNVQANDINRMIRSTILSIITHSLIPIFWIVFLLYIMPMFIARFMELGFEICPPTQCIIKISGITSKFWFLYPFIILLLLIADGAIYFSLLRSLGKFAASLWSFLVLLVEGIFTVLCIIALLLPMMKIISGIE